MPTSDPLGPHAAADPLPEDSEVMRRALEYLERHHCMSVATDGPAGLWAATVFYVNERFLLHFLSLSDSRHARNIESNPRVAATIGDDAEDWGEVGGIQLEGHVARIDDPDEHRAVMAAFSRRYAFADCLWWWTGTSLPPGVERCLYRVEPARLFFVDHKVTAARLEVAATHL
jgi:uncharacterized protein YhbP (UPF0306 family)